MTRLKVTGIVSAVWSYGAQPETDPPGKPPTLIGYAHNANGDDWVSLTGQVIWPAGSYEVVSVDERAWD